MTSYRDEAYKVISEELARNDRIWRRVGGSDASPAQQMLRAERLRVIDRLIALAALDPPGAGGPPAPEHAAPGSPLAGWITENAGLWDGWQPGAWPARDDLDPRGFRWELPPGEDA